MIPEFSLVGFRCLTRLRLCATAGHMCSAILYCVTWSSVARATAESALDLLFYYQPGKLALVKLAVSDEMLMPILTTQDHNGHQPLHGAFQCALSSTVESDGQALALATIQGTMDRMKASNSVYAYVGDALCDL